MLNKKILLISLPGIVLAGAATFAIGYGQGGATSTEIPNTGEIMMQKAEAGDARAQLTVGALMLDKNDVSAAEWLTKSARQGNATAQFQLAQMYADGKGVQKDSMQAWALLTAAEPGLPTPRMKEGHAKLKQKVASSLTPEQMAQAQDSSPWPAAMPAE